MIIPFYSIKIEYLTIDIIHILHSWSWMP